MSRLDRAVQKKYPQYSRTRIQEFIKNGSVLVNQEPIYKPNVLIKETDILSLIDQADKYVSRAGYKLEKALDYFNITVTNKIALDAGISTGGFTDCLLQRGIQHVYGIEVGIAQTVETIKNNPRVTLYEKTNLKTFSSEILGKQVDLITLDLSFISVLKVMPAVKELLVSGGELIILIKPQFETEGAFLTKAGIIKDTRVYQTVINKITGALLALGFLCNGVIESPLRGGDGNTEFLAYYKKQ
jgi:23S rRNA (cytidine1920-2'-O)/16S rRNA (cytidine1409-2'-O)-methyltransferase